jgi:peptidoglycan hydrolase-like protein with peptidoglycan-binding domain
MRTTLIVVAAVTALALPAAAQRQQPDAAQNQPADQNQQSDQNQKSDQGAADQGKQAQGQAMRPSRSQTRMLQTQLNRMGLDAGPADGIMGTKTRAALEKFQSQKGLNASGQLDRETMAALRSLRGQSAMARRSKQGGRSPQPQPENQPQGQQSDQNAPK